MSVYLVLSSLGDIFFPCLSSEFQCQRISSGERTWHTGGTDPNAPMHLSVPFSDSRGKHVTTKHIDRNGNAC
ncbi:hypothetical protein F5X96DRAFT_650649 [Biscogniauxia mediterranea]|nr:hypothetical protein F5X96DRAFT_650649 [Biscogniauxia mediterranea]